MWEGPPSARLSWLGVSPGGSHQVAAPIDGATVDAVLSALRYDTACPVELAAGPSPQDSRPRVLCIDDDREFAVAMKRRLEDRGLEVQQAFSGMEGYRCAFRGDVQAIVLDYEMPDGNGDYLLRRLGENPVTREIPVIALTGHRDKPLERRMTSLGVQRVLAKPPDWDTLWSELQKHLAG